MDGEVLAGRLEPRAPQFVREWAKLRRPALSQIVNYEYWLPAPSMDFPGVTGPNAQIALSNYFDEAPLTRVYTVNLRTGKVTELPSDLSAAPAGAGGHPLPVSISFQDNVCQDMVCPRGHSRSPGK